MRMKEIFLASSALAVLVTAQEASAASDLYVSVFGGANFLTDDSQVLDFGFYSTTETFRSDTDTGFVLGGAIGTNLDNWVNGLKVEMEVSYRRNDVGGTWTNDNASDAGFIDANLSTFAIMANAWYEIGIGSKVRPYVGGGVGWARTQADIAFVATTGSSGSDQEENAGFAWQLGLGMNYEVAPDVDVGIGYRYFVGPRFDEFHPFNSDAVHDNENHAVQVNLTIGIN
jgi:opacity protein-like surface antigen